MPDGDNLKVLVVGGGGREHAICWKLAKSPSVSQVFCAPGNGGTAREAKTENVEIGVMDFAGLATFCRSRSIDLVVVGPDDPLAAGLVDHLQAEGLKVFGPRKALAQIEASKAFAKHFMVEHKMPTARFIVADNHQDAVDAVREHPWARVVKADGLALGKGVFVCDDEAQAVAAVDSIFQERKFGSAGERVVLEERIAGEEMSLLLFCDGKRFLPMPPLQDHKRRFDGDRGPNTGGMGAYSPVELYSRCHQEIDDQVLVPLRQALQSPDFDYQGVLFIGLMVASRMVDDGRVYQPYVLEFNARFGDPETQAILPLMESDLLDVLLACTDGSLDAIELQWSRQASCCVVAAAESYPESSSKGEKITVSELPADVTVFHAGTKIDNGQLVTNGGRILAVTAVAKTLDAAVSSAYSGLDKVAFDSIAFRKDIAKRSGAACLSP